MLTIIPARGGSKGLPDKNIKPLMGKPLIAYTIEAALGARTLSRVVVSTDHPAIADIARQFGAEVPFLRPAHLATDDSPAIETYLHAIDSIERQGEKVDEVVVLLPTCPLRSSTDIDEAVELFWAKAADSVVSYTEEQHPVYWHKRIEKDLRLVSIWDDDSLNNRQDYTKTYYPNGAIYVFKREVLNKRLYYSDNSYAFLMPQSRSIDIDGPDDFLMAECFLRKQ